MRENPVKRTRTRSWRTAGATASIATAGLALAAGLAACSSSTSAGATSGASGSSASSPAAASTGASAIAAALQQPTTLTVWAWAPQTADIVKAFEKKYPKVKVNLVNAGTGSAEYTKLETAIKAGSGAPDVAQIEYYALPQFALQGALADLSADGLGSAQSQFSSAVWDSVNIGGKLVGLPQDTGPMALFYNKTVFDKYQPDGADHLGAVRRRRGQAARGQPEGVHRQRHRRPRLRHQHDLGGRGRPVRGQRHQERDHQPAGRRAPRSSPPSGPR